MFPHLHRRRWRPLLALSVVVGALAWHAPAALADPTPTHAVELMPPLDPTPPAWDLDAFCAGLAGRATGIAAAPLEWDGAEWAAIGGGVAISVGTMWAWDEIVRHQLATRRRGHHSRRWAELMGRLGDGTAYRTAGLVGLGVARGARSEWLGTTVFDAWIASEAGGVIAGGFQSLIGRSRPRTLDGAYEYDPFCGCAGSFPSVHSTRAFAVATAITLDTPGWWAVPVGAASYTFAGCVGMSRIIKDGHWASDVLAGAGLGILIGAVTHAASVQCGPLQLGAMVAAEDPRHPALGLAAQLGF